MAKGSKPVVCMCIHIYVYIHIVKYSDVAGMDGDDGRSAGPPAHRQSRRRTAPWSVGASLTTRLYQDYTGVYQGIINGVFDTPGLVWGATCSSFRQSERGLGGAVAVEQLHGLSGVGCRVHGLECRVSGVGCRV